MTDLQKRIIGEFNALPGPEAQHEVLDLIYNALYHQSYLQVIAHRVIVERDAEAASLRSELEEARADLAAARAELEEKKASLRKPLKPAALWNALSREERESIKAEMVDSVFCTTFRDQISTLKKENTRLRKALADTQAALQSLKSVTAEETAPAAPGQKPSPSLLERIFHKQ